MQSNQKNTSQPVSTSAHAAVSVENAHFLCQATGALSRVMQQREDENWVAAVNGCFHIADELQRRLPQLTEHQLPTMTVPKWSAYVRTINQITDMIFLNFAPPWVRPPSREDAQLATEMTTMLLSYCSALNAQ